MLSFPTQNSKLRIQQVIVACVKLVKHIAVRKSSWSINFNLFVHVVKSSLCITYREGHTACTKIETTYFKNYMKKKDIIQITLFGKIFIVNFLTCPDKTFKSEYIHEKTLFLY